MYRFRNWYMRRELAGALGLVRSGNVLDIGSGTGFYVRLWRELGTGSVLGSDITNVAVADLWDQYGPGSAIKLDIGGEQLPALQAAPFDVISAMDMLFHIVDDVRYERAIQNIYSLLKPGGLFVLTENFVHGPTQRASHIVSRTLSEITGLLENVGFEIVRRRPVFWMMNVPMDQTSRLHHAVFGKLHRVASQNERLGGIAGAGAYLVDRAVVPLLREGPSTELMICRRPT
jgi:SAM-dependent methyltransferase